jgi:TPP-dependent pyruvate/acetoin dehydrogenase alpha subunit
MVLIRKFESKILELFSEGLLVGTTHTYLGQEAVGVGVVSALDDEDIIFSNHRCHGHFLAYCGQTKLLMAEIMGKVGGVVGGRGGSQHIHYKNFYSNGIQGGIVSNAAGCGLAEKLKNSGAVTVAFLGDGTLGQGIVYETMNMASLWKIPVLFVVENNKYAQSTPAAIAIAGKIGDRAKAFSIDVTETNSNDVEEIYNISKNLIHGIRSTSEPAVLVCNTYRFGPHSKGDDFRDKAEIESYMKNDPITAYESKHNLPEEKINKYKTENESEIQNAVQFGKESPDPKSLD